MRFSALFVCLVFALPSSAATCESLAKLKLSHTTIDVAESHPAGSFTPPSGKAIPKLPAFCRVAGVIQPSSNSHIQFEVWLPASDWNGKFHGVGNGGFAGAVSYDALGNAVSGGYATASTDTGHHGTGIDASWANGHREKIVDFGYRAVHETALKAKAVIRAFYGKAPQHSYFSSCSNGGRQALMEAQRFPADYDGIIAGAPANYWTHLMSTFVWDVQATMADAASYIPAAKLPAITAAALAACDARDGVPDGVIEDPARCHFDPSRLLCSGPESNACLTEPQLTALKKIYDGLPNSKGERIFPGFSHGGEADTAGWGPWITGQAPGKSLIYGFGTQFFANMVYSNPAWDFHTYEAGRDTQTADEKMAPLLNATNPDLRAFQKRGGKLLMYHGWSDAAIPALNAIDYYQSVVSKMGSQDTAAFLRLYMVPGMDHCGGGPGPNSFGQFGVAHGDALHDIDRALERWVEEGAAPDHIVATKYKTGMDIASGVARTRPLCPYPQVAHWKGSGSTDDAANFVCAAPQPPPTK